MENEIAKANVSWLAPVFVLFGLLLLASHSNELLKQTVIGPGSSADLGFAADCREDELEEEQLSLEECQLMVSNVRIILSSSPQWFRPYQLILSSMGVAATLFSLVTAFGLINRQRPPLRLAIVSIAMLLIVDVAGFVAALNTGPLLRAQYLWPLLLWICIHLCMLVAVIRFGQQDEMDS
ncbi:MAG: hypothetical protein COB20_15190 [SAR86 cluster bacterium]|uniref:Uncharacterized protein n=1 Tax=SAR86 cluster bacterium TaxID=2030880 RepID=A0A2A4WWP5_9GAMM|nr:MAG: hypothetical protein COB20_15190 [SAR86 cluster bacterium]